MSYDEFPQDVDNVELQWSEGGKYLHWFLKPVEVKVISGTLDAEPYCRDTI